MIDTDQPGAYIAGTDRAVSPVIGVILMIAITVILAAVIGTFVLDFGQRVGDTGPTASLSVRDAGAAFAVGAGGDEAAVEMTHEGGDGIGADDLRIVVRNDSTNAVISAWEGGGIVNGSSTVASYYRLNGDNMTTSDTITTGDVVTIYVDSDAGGSGVRNRWVVAVVDTVTGNQIGSARVDVR